MTTKQLKSFITVADTGSFYKAAERLFVTPTALIQQTNLLESEIGFKLFNRSHSGVTLTEAGDFFLDHVKFIDDKITYAIEKGRQISRSVPTVLRIAVISQHGRSDFFGISRIIAEEKLPITLELVSVSHNEAVDALLNHRVDICIMSGNSAVFSSKLCHVHLRDIPCKIGVPPDHPLYKSELIHIEDFSGCSFVLPREGLFDSGDTFRKSVLSLFPDAVIYDEDDNLRTEALCIQKNLCRISTSSQPGSRLKYIPLKPDINFNLYAVYNPEMKKLLEPILKKCKEL